MSGLADQGRGLRATGSLWRLWDQLVNTRCYLGSPFTLTYAFPGIWYKVTSMFVTPVVMATMAYGRYYHIQRG